jgi:hypothetical protein
MTFGQRGWKEQPLGGFKGLGISPFSTMCSRFLSSFGLGMGTADSNALV